MPQSTAQSSSQSLVQNASTEVDLDGEDKSWQDMANCLGVEPDLFFPERGASTREAKEVCKGCVVRDDCLEYALANGEKFGIWGGMSERERRRIRRQRALARAAAAPARTATA
ncbi:MAG: WhiB family transcriptional regulator [Acidimicrobiales bacterium]